MMIVYKLLGIIITGIIFTAWAIIVLRAKFKEDLEGVFADE